jgi:hypothetical protein
VADVIIRAVLDVDTCEGCRRANGATFSVVDGTIPTFCQKVIDGTGVCRCVTDPVPTSVPHDRGGAVPCPRCGSPLLWAESHRKAEIVEMPIPVAPGGTFKCSNPECERARATAAYRDIMDRVARGELVIEGLEADPKLAAAIAAGNALSTGGGRGRTAVRFKSVLDADTCASCRRWHGGRFVAPVGERKLTPPCTNPNGCRCVTEAVPGVVPDIRDGVVVGWGEAPAPWRWDGAYLLDAAGKPLLELEERFGGEMGGPRVRALIEAAPQMFGLLFHWSRAIDRDAVDINAGTRALLAQIEERSRG